MKKRKKVLSLLAAAVMTMTMVLPVSAAGTTEGEGGGDSPAAPAAGESTYTLTIKTGDANAGHDFQAYQVFTGTVNDAKDTMSDIEWGSDMKDTSGDVEDGLLSKIKEVKLADGTQPFKDCTDAASVAEVLSATRDESGTVQKFSKAVAEVVKEKEGEKAESEIDGKDVLYKIKNLKAGYYLVLDKANAERTLVPSANIVRLIGEDMEIDAKINTATVTKFSGEETAEDSAQYSVGDTVSYTLRGTLPANYDGSTTAQDTEGSGYKYVFTDVFEKELIPANDWKYENENDVDKKVTSGVTVSVLNGEERTDVTDQFDIKWNSDEQTLNVGTDALNELKKDGEALVTKDSLVIVKYDALLNAKGDTAGIDNKVKLQYGENETAEVEETVFTLGLKINKVDGSDTKTGLANAEFQLSRTVTKDNNTEVTYLKKAEDGKISWVEKDEATTLTSDKDGKIDIMGIPEGTYTLTETKAPDGYNKLDKPVNIVIDAVIGKNDSDKKVLTGLSVKTKFEGEADEKYKEGEADMTKGDVTITVANNKGAVLPSTGGMGVKVLYVAGAILMVIAGVLLVTRKRMNSK